LTLALKLLDIAPSIRQKTLTHIQLPKIKFMAKGAAHSPPSRHPSFGSLMTEHSDFEDTATNLSSVLHQLIAKLKGETLTLRELMQVVGEQGLLLACAVASLPFLIPVSIPGVSTVFGAAIILISIAITLNRLPWLPASILDRKMETAKLIPALEKGANIVGKFDRFTHPRMLAMTHGTNANRINGLAILAGGILLALPLSLIPFSNTLPAVAILLFTTGMIQRDGVLVIGGYVFLVLTLIYFTAIGYAAFWAGSSLTQWYAG
jgi:hypothetical protein